MSLGPQFAAHLRQATTAMTLGGLGAAMAVTGMTHEAPRAGYANDRIKTETQSEMFAESRAHHPTNQPAWNKALSTQFEGFRDVEHMPKGAIPSRVAVVPKNGAPHTMGFNKAYRINNDNEPANNVWTVGWK